LRKSSIRESLSADSAAFGGGPKVPAGRGAVTAAETAIAAGNVAHWLRDADLRENIRRLSHFM